MSKTYAIAIKQGEEYVANAEGNIDVIAYAAKHAGLDTPDAVFSVELTETDGIMKADVRTVLKLTADGETVDALIGSKVRKERKANKVAGEPENAETPEPALV